MSSLRLVLVIAFLGFCCAGRLNNYLPPEPKSYLPPGGNGGGSGTSPAFGGNGGRAGAQPSSGADNGGAQSTSRLPGGDGGVGGGSSADAQAAITSYENDNDGSGNYKYSFETSNGIKMEETGQLNNSGSENEAESVSGSVSYTAPDGTPIKLEYTADENGFVPKGDHLPTSPPIPPEILKSLQDNAAEEAAAGGAGNDGNGASGGNGYSSGGNGYSSNANGYSSNGPSGRTGGNGNGAGGANGYKY